MASALDVRTRAARIAAPVIVIALAVAALTAFPTQSARAADYPGEDEISAARAAANDAAMSVAQLDAAVASLEDALAEAEVAALIAAEDYLVAQEAAATAQEEWTAAEATAKAAEEELAIARRGLAGAAMSSYRNAGSMSELEAITQSDGFNDVVARHEAIDRASAEADVTVQEVRAAELVAETMRARAEAAADKAAAAEQLAEEALGKAESSRAAADQAVSDAAVARGAAITRLAEMRGVTEQLEQERQNGLAAEREAQAQAAFEAEQAQLEAERAEQESSSGASETSNTTSTPKPSTSATSTPKPSETSTSRPTQTSDPEPTETSEPEPTETSTPDPEPTETQTSEPKPTQTSKPEPEPDNAWNSSASQGASAAAWAQTKIGAAYQWGGNGPAYDCSGLTSAAWGQAGHYISRTSRSQYQNVSLIPYSQIRPGDLVFWGSGKDSSRIYHVAIYIGAGRVMEATVPGKTATTRSMYNWAVGDMMPYVGRP
ncbi:C40 family peptidase [Demequina flava]|uniref:C40 family peptidase n=1 Tax=Demequina flava TaxID=1095025 RepID=UPI000783DFE5|nr:NlpC/P60 family protein [Demequina flava]